MREIYDPPKLRRDLQKARKERDQALARQLLKKSNVRRSDQTRGALEPDLVIEGCPCWLELQHATVSRPLDKLAQAERDVEESNSDLWPVAVCKTTNSQSVSVWLRGWTLLALCGYAASGLIQQMVCRISFEDFMEVLRDEYC